MNADVLPKALALLLCAALGAPTASVAAPADGLAARDHGPHVERGLEWWSVAAELTGEDGAAYGATWTLLRQSISPDPEADGWSAPQVWIARASVTSAELRLSEERTGRGGTGEAGAVARPFRAWLGDWRFESAGAGPDAPFAPLRLTARGADFAFDLRLDAGGPLIPHEPEGGPGASRAPGGYADPFLGVSGTLTLQGREVSVTGRGWLDREWTVPPAEDRPPGRIRFALHLAEGAKLTVHRLRGADGRERVVSRWISADGAVVPLGDGAVALLPLGDVDPKAGEAALEWEIAVPSRGLRLRTAPLNPRGGGGAEGWEGPIRCTGAEACAGRLEITGYRVRRADPM